MPRPLTIHDLLNPSPVPQETTSFPHNNSEVATTHERSMLVSSNASVQRSRRHSSYQLNRKVTLSAVYEYDVGTSLEYPETGCDREDAIGHLFKMDPYNWVSPARNFAYSRGSPRGVASKPGLVPLLVDSETGKMVPSIVRHSTCQGVKMCPFYGSNNLQMNHSSASRDELQKRVLHDRERKLEFSSPSREVFRRTCAFLTALRRSGCTSISKSESNGQSMRDGSVTQVVDSEQSYLRRGYPEQPNKCRGRLIFGYMFNGTPFVKCEYHSRLERDHFFDGSVGNGSYDLEYLEAVLTEDQEETTRIETEAEASGYGPRLPCQTITNNSSQRLFCPCDHRDDADGLLKQPQMIPLSCSCTFREYEPQEEYRLSCPYILVVSKGPHLHPIPLPEKTPLPVKSELNLLVKELDVDLADITPRQFLRHPIVKSYLAARFPLIRNPMLSDLHISLSNRSHLKVYIENIKKDCFPEGTGWKGLIHLKMLQDSVLHQEELYIRTLLEVPSYELQNDGDDLPEDQSIGTEALRIAICMSPEASKRFVKAQHIQSDISFRRVIGFYEFEITAVDEGTNTSVTFCRAYVTQQTAFTHLQTLREINRILLQDTGRGLQWRHIHGRTIDDYRGNILNWVVDQHRGQAKGIGLYAQEVAQNQTLGFKRDFHEPLRLISALDPYDHLRRFLTLCTVHFARNVKRCSVSEETKSLMRGLVCIQHDSWEETLNQICVMGGKAGENWIADKDQCKFAFAAICWEKSFIPLDIWNSRRRDSNVVEIAHANVNKEGINCTLVGGVQKARHFDNLKLQSLQIHENFGIRESYQSKHPSENALRNLRRKAHIRQKTLAIEDQRIEAHNSKMNACLSKLHSTQRNVAGTFANLQRQHSLGNASGVGTASASWERAKAQEEKARVAYQKQGSHGKSLGGSGSGKVGLLLPTFFGNVA